MMAQCRAMIRYRHLVLGAALAVTALVTWDHPARPAPRVSWPGSGPAGPRAPVHVVTDRWGIPHLRAASLDDLYYGWGWVTGRDRLWQIMAARRAARGELSEWLGNVHLQDDGG